MPNHSGVGGISHHTDFPSLALICLSVAIRADWAIRGCAISSDTLARIAVLDASSAFLSFFFLRIQMFPNQTRSDAVQLKPDDLQTSPQLPLPEVLPQCHLPDEPSSDALVAWLPTHTRRCIEYKCSNPSLVVAWLHPF